MRFDASTPREQIARFERALLQMGVVGPQRAIQRALNGVALEARKNIIAKLEHVFKGGSALRLPIHPGCLHDFRQGLDHIRMPGPGDRRQLLDPVLRFGAEARMTTIRLLAQLAATLGSSHFARPAVVTLSGVGYPTTAIGLMRDQIETLDGGDQVIVGRSRVWQVEVASLPSPAQGDRIAVGSDASKRIKSCVDNGCGGYEIGCQNSM